jgi:excisionase family DNA binding protein
MSTGAPPGADGNGRGKRVEVNTQRRGAAAEIVPLVAMEEVARWLGTSVRHVQRLVTERRLPYVKVGHFVRFDPRDVAQWIEAQKVGSEDEATPLAITIGVERQVAPPVPLTRRPTGAADILARWQTESR